MKHLFIFCLMMCSSALLTAQTYTESKVYLKGGQTLEGKLLSYQQGVGLSIQTEKKKPVEVPEKAVHRVVQRTYLVAPARQSSKNTAEVEKVAYAFKERGMYNSIYFSSLNGQEGDEFKIGFGIHNVTGYQFNRLLGIGLGIGLDSYSFIDGENLYPIFLEGRGYLTKSKVAPYYSLSAGYGFLFGLDDGTVTETEGGAMGRAAIGVRLGANSGSNVLIDAGYQLQEAYFRRVSDNTGETEETTVLYNRIAIRVGLIF